MFGFGKKNKENVLNEININLTSVLTNYVVGRSMLKHKIEANELKKVEKELFEATYLFGVAIGANYYVDPEWKIISREEIVDLVSLAAFENKIFDSTNKASELFSMVLISQNQSIINQISTIGTMAAINCIAALKDNDSGSALKSMNIDFFSDKNLANDFKIFFQKNLSKNESNSKTEDSTIHSSKKNQIEKTKVNCKNISCNTVLNLKSNSDGVVKCPECGLKFYVRT